MGTISRRQFLRVAGAGCALLGGGLLPVSSLSPRQALAAPSPLSELLRTAPRARFWTPAGGSDRTAVQCLLCAHRCRIAAGERGRCRVRMNAGGELRSLSYGRPMSVHVDPIEKKPFYHFLPGSPTFSFGTVGCPLRCSFCQNWQLSQANPEDRETPYVPPGEMATAAAREAPVIAFTYNEATVFTEYLLDTAARARVMGMRTVLVSCGYMNEAPLSEMLSVLDAVKIDLKGYSPDFYRKVCEAEMAPVLRSIGQVAKSGVHLEIVNLVVPGLNDSERMLSELSAWVASEAGVDVPLHFTRFHPDYKMRNLPPTPVSALERARESALAKGIRYAYVGNVPGHAGNHTYCPGCGKAVLKRSGFFVTESHLDKGKCSRCRRTVAGVWT